MTCANCGKCCYYQGEKCPMLLIRKDGSTRCRIYRRRLNKVFMTESGKKFKCTLRRLSDYDYEGCEYNSGKKMWKGGVDG